MAGQYNIPDGPPLIERIDDPELLLVQIQECIDLQDSRGLKTYILEHKLREESIFWELILKIGSQVSTQVSEENATFFDVCNRCLLYLIKMGKPKEMLLAVLEQLDTFVDDIKYKCFLPLLQETLFKISAKLFHSLDIALETVSAHIRGLQMPENVTLEGEERKLYHLDKEVVRIVDNLETFLDFLQPFVKSVALCRGTLSDARKNEALVLKKHLIRLLSFPLMCLDLTADPERAKTNSRLCAEKVMELLSDVETDFQRLISSSTNPISEKDLEKKPDDEQFKEEEKEYDNRENEQKVRQADESADSSGGGDFVENWDFLLEVTEDAQACLAYIIHVEHLGVDKYPQVYSHEFLLEFSLISLRAMLKNTFYPINYKGLLLLKARVDVVQPETFDAGLLDNPHFMAVINDLIHIMTRCPLRDHRMLATSLFTTVIKRFQAAGRYQIYTNILSSCSHSGVKGFIITILKNDISHFLQQRNAPEYSTKTETQFTTSFQGAKIMRLISLAISLPDKETTDMLENSDQIISALNMMRFLVMADPFSVNVTGIWNSLSEIEDNFLSPLRLGLDMSHAHYKLELKNVKEGKATESNVSSEAGLSLSVGGVDLPKLEKEERISLVERALNTHELMISLLCRLTELIQQNKGPQEIN